MRRKQNAVSIALRFDRELRRVDERTRNMVAEFLWFTYVGKDFDWQCVQLRRKEEKVLNGQKPGGYFRPKP